MRTIRAYELSPLAGISARPRTQGRFDAARGDVIVSMDGDLQHDPEEIPAFVAKIEEGYDIVSGGEPRGRTGG